MWFFKKNKINPLKQLQIKLGVNVEEHQGNTPTFGEILMPRNTTQGKERKSFSIQWASRNSSTGKLMKAFIHFLIFFFFYLCKPFLWEETVEIGEPNNPNDGTAQCNHHFFLKMQSEAYRSQTTMRGITLYTVNNDRHWFEEMIEQKENKCYRG